MNITVFVLFPNIVYLFLSSNILTLSFFESSILWFCSKDNRCKYSQNCLKVSFLQQDFLQKLLYHLIIGF